MSSLTKQNHSTRLMHQLNEFIQSELNDPVSPYRRNIVGSRMRVLESIYPAIALILEENEFKALTLVYASHYPSTHWNINIYGEQFPQLLRAQSNGTRAHHHRWEQLADLAKVESIINQLYYAENHHRVTKQYRLCVTLRADDIVALVQTHPFVVLNNISRELTPPSCAITESNTQSNRSCTSRLYDIQVKFVGEQIEVNLKPMCGSVSQLSHYSGNFS